MPARDPVPARDPPPVRDPPSAPNPRRRSTERIGPLALAVLLWAALVAVSLAVRPLLPVDETRYASVAWEMWRSGDLLVPHMNGLPYSDKPPLLFWSIQLAWAAFGVHAWAARLVPALFGLGTLVLVAGIARELWPDRPAVAARTPLVLAGLLLWAGFTGALMFDLPLAFFVAAAVRTLLAARRRPAAGWALFAVALGLGILTKGPVALVPALAVALTAPWWSPAPPALRRVAPPRRVALVRGAGGGHRGGGASRPRLGAPGGGRRRPGLCRRPVDRADQGAGDRRFRPRPALVVVPAVGARRPLPLLVLAAALAGGAGCGGSGGFERRVRRHRRQRRPGEPPSAGATPACG